MLLQKKKEQHHPKDLLFFLEVSRRRPIFPGGHPPSIVGTDELNCRVRDGNGWDLTAIYTDYYEGIGLSE